MKVYCVIVTYSYHYNSPEFERVEVFKEKNAAEKYAEEQRIKKNFFSYTVEEKEVM